MSSDKTEKPTSQKLRQQRRDGQIPSHKNTAEAGSIIFATGILFLMLPALSVTALSMATVAWDSINGTWLEALRKIVPAISKLALLFLMSVALMAIFSLLLELLLNKFNFSARKLTPKFEKFNPFNNVKQLFSLDSLVSLLIKIVYFCFSLINLYFSIYNNTRDVISASTCGMRCLVGLYVNFLKINIGVFLLLCLCIGAADYIIQKRLFLRRNKMTKDEVKREYKTHEGDPHIKSARKSIAITDAMLPGPQQATHVIYGEQCLVAVIYHVGKTMGPFVIGTAKGPSVVRMCALYKELGIPTIFLPSVALDFFRMAELGNFLPPRSAHGMKKILQMAPSKA
ncbi:hypothetical protein DUT91_23290 [Phyllobacterium salinisoli]|uniref:EscU/YscU/HrcU family type III secretion system export apparatus switch protein n=1 Tax=Phyllobacterium salinisoli TaxID=1899321 RepID=A0A368JWN1_9HYPH|nr:EscU/YscU/HrcU family type III secretion system export apparatus switch protein [Phyllobacterium salinisoli]RCS21567.1 hypothetical protein DUT91_23290 [Phyllobacterium salinisoli]